MKIKGQAGALTGKSTVPGDKSISHRAVMLGALAEGESVIEGFLAGEDCLSTISCFKQLGVEIKRSGQTVHVSGVGLNGLKKPEKPLYVGNSGTTIRIMSGVLAAQPFMTVVDGDASIRKRPMKRVINPLQDMGAMIISEPGGKAPLIFRAPENGQLKGIRHDLQVASAQVKSALLLSGLYTKTPVTVKEPALSRDHTERMLKTFGVEVKYNNDGSVTMPVGQNLKAATIDVPGDVSSAAFILVAAAICPGSCVTVKNVGLNYTRAGIIEVMRDMGADIKLDIKGEGSEPVGDITIKYAPLKGTEMISGEIIPRLIDEIPAIAVLAVTAEGKTTIKDAGELRVKESDRIKLIVDMLEAFGAKVIETEDGMIISGGCKTLKAASDIKVAGDHRMAMAASVAALIAEGETVFDDESCIDVSFPGFAKTMVALGADMQEGYK